MPCDPPKQTGIISSVFGFLSREAHDFVSTVTGNSLEEIPSKPRPSSSRRQKRPKDGVRRARRQSRRRSMSSEEEEELEDEELDEYRRRDHPARRRSSTASPVPRRPPRAPVRPPSPKDHAPRRVQSRKSPSPDPGAQNDEEPLSSNHAASQRYPSLPSPSPPPPSRVLKRRPSITMPGSLYPRSPSMDPDEESLRKVRFASSRERSPSVEADGSLEYVEYEVPLAGPSSSPDGPQRGRQTSAFSPVRPRSGSAVGSAVQRFSDDADSSLLLPAMPHSPSRWRGQHDTFAPLRTDTQQDGIDSDTSMTRPKSAKAKGKERAVDPGPSNADMSGEIRVRGKERELVAVRQEQLEKVLRWEEEADTTLVREERDEYQAKIKQLEEEVKRLRDELAKRPTNSSASYHNPSWQSMPPPPPPPPPPPLPALNVRIPTATDTGALFANVRASLKSAPPPQEAPINAAAYGSKSKRTGQPTVNVPTDKMAAFLTEMKTVRLRKIAGPADLKRGWEPSASTSALPRRPSLEPAAGEKRKRTETSGSEVRSDAPNQKRRLTAFGPMRRPPSLVNPLSRSLRNWPSSSVDGTTPSLASDNDVSETSPDDRNLPPTPPTVPVSDTHGPVVVVHNEEGHLIQDDVSDVHMASPKKRAPLNARRAVTPVNAAASMSITFLEKRTPTSPMPTTTPRKPPRPSRKQASRQLMQELDEEDDPLLLSQAGSKPLSATPPVKGKKANATASKSAKGSRQQSASSNRNASQGPSNSHDRRRTLDDELRELGAGLREDDLYALVLEEEEVFQAPATPGRRKSFLAHGGAGGPAIRMGVGYVEGLHTDSEEEEEEVPASRARLGRSAAVSRGGR